MTNESSYPKIPNDFPRTSYMAALPGIQPKIAVRLIQGKYVSGWTDEELQERYENCIDLAQQLSAYCTRKALEHPEWSNEFNLQRTARGISQHANAGRWDVTPQEQTWIMLQVKTLLGW